MWLHKAPLSPHGAPKTVPSNERKARLDPHGARGVVASHPLRMRKALGSNPSVSRALLLAALGWMHAAWACVRACTHSCKFLSLRMGSPIPSARFAGARRCPTAIHTHTHQDITSYPVPAAPLPHGPHRPPWPQGVLARPGAVAPRQLAHTTTTTMTTTTTKHRC